MNTKKMFYCALGIGFLVLLSQSLAFAAPKGFGNKLGEVKGVAIYSNGNCGYVSGESSYADKTKRIYLGIKWQCVEFARRYTYVKKGYLIPRTPSAKSLWYNASSLGLNRAKNGSDNRPRNGDMVISTDGDYGHVGIIEEAPSNPKKDKTYTVTVGHQNWSTQSTTKSPTIKLTLTVKKKDGKLYYYLSDFDKTHTYKVKGWAWPK